VVAVVTWGSGIYIVQIVCRLIAVPSNFVRDGLGMHLSNGDNKEWNVFGGIDAGGTSWRCAIFSDHETCLARASFPTTTPEETLGRAVDFFNTQRASGLSIQTIGIACFGPLGVNKNRCDWGFILDTTKPFWSQTDVAGALAAGTGCVIAIETDVTAAAFAERAWGAGVGIDNVAYVTVGTGIGAGIILNGSPVSGALHPEAGHMRAPRHPDDPTFDGVCAFHGDCIEGLASAPALKARWGLDAAELADDHIAWDIEAHYLAHLAVNLVLTTAVQRVIFGGGVCARAGLVARVAQKATMLLGPYGTAAPGGAGFEVVSAGLGLDAGLLGALWLAQRQAARPN
jgi:fructokinase